MKLIGFVLALSWNAQLGLAQAQSNAVRPNTSQILFVGCESDGQAGPVPAPANPRQPLVSLPPAGFAYFAAEGGPGVLAPSSWRCFRMYGSSGDSLVVRPSDAPLGWGQFTSDGPQIEITRTIASGSGGPVVAELIYRVFPELNKNADEVVNAFGLKLEKGPFKQDSLTYLSKSAVQYRTPGGQKGLGNLSPNPVSALPTDGIAAITSPGHNAILLSVRLPPELQRFSAAVIEQVKFEYLRPPAK
jgi:hypothetical protein